MRIQSIRFVLLFSILQLAGLSDIMAQDPMELYRVVLVKGKPKRQGNQPVLNGQKMLDKDKVLFTSLQDVVILMNSHFDRLYLRPKGKTDLNKLKEVVAFVPKSPHPAEIPITATTRGLNKSLNIQSLSDTLRIELYSFQNSHSGLTASDFTLYDVFMEEVKNSIRLEGNNLLLTLPKPGVFILYIKESSRPTEVLAEIECLAKDEVLAELRFVAKSVLASESVIKEQIRYMNRVYPYVSNDQITMVLNQK